MSARLSTRVPSRVEDHQRKGCRSMPGHTRRAPQIPAPVSALITLRPASPPRTARPAPRQRRRSRRELDTAHAYQAIPRLRGQLHALHQRLRNLHQLPRAEAGGRSGVRLRVRMRELGGLELQHHRATEPAVRAHRRPGALGQGTHFRPQCFQCQVFGERIFRRHLLHFPGAASTGRSSIPRARLNRPWPKLPKCACNSCSGRMRNSPTVVMPRGTSRRASA